MTGKGRTGPRERQTMSGTLSDRGQPGATPEPTMPVAGDPPPEPFETETVIVEQQALVQLSLWKRMLEAAEREFDRDDPFWAGEPSTANQREATNPRGAGIGRNRDENET